MTKAAAGAPDRLDRARTGRRTAGARPRMPNARFTAPAGQCPVIDADWENPQGVPISAFIFGGRRSTVVPLVYQAFNWTLRRVHGRDDGLGDDRRGRRASSARCGATRSRCCRSAATTWPITSTTGSSSAGRSPTRRGSSASTGSARDEDGKFLWPGFGENMRVLKWIVERAHGQRGRHREPARLDAALRRSRLDGAWKTSRRRSSTR